jgi:hypothetical protein
MNRLLPILLLVLLAGCVTQVRGQQWYAGHFGGYPVPTITNCQDVAELPVPQPGSAIRIVSTLTTTNTPALLGDLTGKTIIATTWTECSNAPTFFFNNDCGNGVPVNMRLFFTSDQRPYTENNGRGSPSNFWWSDAPTGWAPIACGTNTLTCALTPDGWSDALGHLASDSNYTSSFLATAQNVAQIGLSFGGGCYYDNGCGISNNGASATLHVLRYDAQAMSVVLVQVLLGTLAGDWTNAGPPLLLTNLPSPSLLKLAIGRQ